MGPSECLGGIWEINFSQPPRGGAVRRVPAVRGQYFVEEWDGGGVTS
jgi:hypothetical protein